MFQSLVCNTGKGKTGIRKRITQGTELLEKIKPMINPRSKIGMAPMGGAELFNSTVLPSMLYGSETLPLKKMELKAAENVQIDAARTILGVPHKGVPIWMLLEELGWYRMESIYHRRVLQFAAHLLCTTAVLPSAALELQMQKELPFSKLLKQILNKHHLTAKYDDLLKDVRIAKTLEHWEKCDLLSTFKREWDELVGQKLQKYEKDHWINCQQDDEHESHLQSTSEVGLPGKPQPYIRSGSRYATYGFILRRGFIGPCWQEPNQCPFCKKSKSDSYNHFLHNCKHSTLQSYQLKLKQLLGNNYKHVEAIIGNSTTSQPGITNVDTLHIILDIAFKIF